MIKLKLKNDESAKKYLARACVLAKYLDGLDQQGRLSAVCYQCGISPDLFYAINDNIISGGDWTAVRKSDIKQFEKRRFADLPDQTDIDPKLEAVAGFSVIVVSTTDGKTFICPECELPKLEQLLDGMSENEREPDFSSGMHFMPIKW